MLGASGPPLPGPNGPSAWPAGFPAELTREVDLLDGRRVLLRPVLPEDEAELRRAVAEADAETLRLRFLGGRPPRTDADFQHLVRVDYTNRLAVVAVTPEGRGAGIARYERLRDGHDTGPDPASDGGPRDIAEIAVAVDPAWRQVGLASELVRLLAEGAVKQGIVRFQAEFFADNIEVSDLLTEAGVRYVSSLDETGVVTVHVLLPESGVS